MPSLTPMSLRDVSVVEFAGLGPVSFAGRGAPLYTTYETSDGGSMAVGGLEPHFYAELLSGLALDAADLPDQYDQSDWPVLRQIIAARFATRTRSEWIAVFDGTDACATPVLSLSEAPDYPHSVVRGVLGGPTGHQLPNPAPRIGSEHTRPLSDCAPPGVDSTTILAELGLRPDDIEGLCRCGAAS